MYAFLDKEECLTQIHTEVLVIALFPVSVAGCFSIVNITKWNSSLSDYVAASQIKFFNNAVLKLLSIVPLFCNMTLMQYKDTSLFYKARKTKY
jgi:hypothetical protein